MREIKFRGKRLNDFKEEKEFVYGQYQIHNLWDDTPKNYVKHAVHFLELNESPYCNGHMLNKMEYVSERTLGQYSTFNDVEGNEIYENDIVTDSYKRIMQVIWRNGKFMLKALKETNFMYADMFEWFELNDLMDVKIIGNIYDNLEFLENIDG